MEQIGKETEKEEKKRKRGSGGRICSSEPFFYFGKKSKNKKRRRCAMFEKALKIVTVELEESLLCEPNEFLEALWGEIKYEMKKLAGENASIAWNLNKFIEKVKQEVESRKVDLRKFRNEKGELITNLFKKLIREVAKESNIALSNDALSRLINFIRNQYSTAGTLAGALYPAKAFFYRDEYDIPDYYTTGDDNSCFRAGGCNEGSALWLVNEDEKFDRAKFVVFHYKAENKKEGWGRCWAYKVSNRAIYATNFYSCGFEIKAQWLKYAVVRVLRMLFDLSENVRFAFGKNICLPIYLNGDGLIIYEKEYQSSEEVIEFSRGIESECMSCKSLIELKYLRVFQEEDSGGVKGVIMCLDCYDFMENSEECYWCGNILYRDDMYYHDGVYWCEICFVERFERCEICGEVFWKNDMAIDRNGDWLCLNCANKYRRQCGICGEWVYPDEVHTYEVLNAYLGIEEIYVCKECEQDLIKAKCESCGREFYFSKRDYEREVNLRDMIHLGLCYECFKLYCKRIKDEIFYNEQQLALPFDPIEVLLI